MPHSWKRSFLPLHLPFLRLAVAVQIDVERNLLRLKNKRNTEQQAHSRSESGATVGNVNTNEKAADSSALTTSTLSTLAELSRRQLGRGEEELQQNSQHQNTTAVSAGSEGDEPADAVPEPTLSPDVDEAADNSKAMATEDEVEAAEVPVDLAVSSSSGLPPAPLDRAVVKQAQDQSCAEILNREATPVVTVSQLFAAVFEARGSPKRVRKEVLALFEETGKSPQRQVPQDPDDERTTSSSKKVWCSVKLGLEKDGVAVSVDATGKPEDPELLQAYLLLQEATSESDPEAPQTGGVLIAALAKLREVAEKHGLPVEEDALHLLKAAEDEDNQAAWRAKLQGRRNVPVLLGASGEGRSSDLGDVSHLDGAGQASGPGDEEEEEEGPAEPEAPPPTTYTASDPWPPREFCVEQGLKKMAGSPVEYRVFFSCPCSQAVDIEMASALDHVREWSGADNSVEYAVRSVTHAQRDGNNKTEVFHWSSYETDPVSEEVHNALGSYSTLGLSESCGLQCADRRKRVLQCRKCYIDIVNSKQLAVLANDNVQPWVFHAGQFANETDDKSLSECLAEHECGPSFVGLDAYQSSPALRKRLKVSGKWNPRHPQWWFHSGKSDTLRDCVAFTYDTRKQKCRLFPPTFDPKQWYETIFAVEEGGRAPSPNKEVPEAASSDKDAVLLLGGGSPAATTLLWTAPLAPARRQ
ncbi:unnamed protein product [Amoebophrya sp. A120]|nr:unnamed protein product [Amoebophrya sp. A120]|eukprot:GSA120T00021545001.1